MYRLQKMEEKLCIVVHCYTARTPVWSPHCVYCRTCTDYGEPAHTTPLRTIPFKSVSAILGYFIFESLFHWDKLSLIWRIIQTHYSWIKKQHQLHQHFVSVMNHEDKLWLRHNPCLWIWSHDQSSAISYKRPCCNNVCLLYEQIPFHNGCKY